MAKWTGLAEQFDSGHDVFVQQEGAHVQLSVEVQSGANAGVVLLTPAQARAISAELSRLAILSDEYGEEDQ